MQTPDLAARLRAMAAADGGWPYYAGRASRVEATCWALLALGDGVDRQPHVAFLERCRVADGLLADPGSPEPNSGWTGLALLTLRAGGLADAFRRTIQADLVAARGVQLTPEQTAAIPQDGMLQAWSWTPGTFSWVEPTAYCLLALKQASSPTPAIAQRIADGNAVLLDRVCPEGGWNYGNSAVLGQDLRPYVATTALGLLAMQDQGDAEPIRRSLAWLEAHQLSERATMALALTVLALAAFDRPVDAPRAALEALGAETGYLDNAHLMAMALYIATLDTHGGAAFRLARGAGQRAPEGRE